MFAFAQSKWILGPFFSIEKTIDSYFKWVIVFVGSLCYAVTESPDVTCVEMTPSAKSKHLGVESNKR